MRGSSTKYTSTPLKNNAREQYKIYINTTQDQCEGAVQNIHQHHSRSMRGSSTKYTSTPLKINAREQYKIYINTTQGIGLEWC
jgi:hypothetical protein